MTTEIQTQPSSTSPEDFGYMLLEAARAHIPGMTAYETHEVGSTVEPPGR